MKLYLVTHLTPQPPAADGRELSPLARYEARWADKWPFEGPLSNAKLIEPHCPMCAGEILVGEQLQPTAGGIFHYHCIN